MIRARASRATTAVLLALCLNGCAAAAIPVLAGAGIVRIATDGEEAGTVEVAASEAEVATPEIQPEPKPLVTDVASTTTPAPISAPLTAEERADAILTAALGPDPAAKAPAQPATATPAPSPLPPAMGPSPYAQLIDYAAKAVRVSDNTSTMLTAMLVKPSALDAKRKMCAGKSPVVLIDLDPHEGRLKADEVAAADPVLAKGLSELREKGLTIAWISQGTAGDAGSIRTALTRTRLDPEAKDSLVLMRYPDDRKQTRRSELASENCIIAIAGDHREDFDELYEYLVKPEAAQALETLIGNGWFLVPPALGGET